MDGQVYYEDNKTYCPNICTEFDRNQLFPALTIFSIIGIVILVPTLILQLFFIYRYKSTLLHRQFLYTTVVVILLNVIYIIYSSTVDVGCPLFQRIVNSLNRYLFYVEMMQMTTIHLLLLYKLCKHMETRTMQRLQTLCCNICPCLCCHLHHLHIEQIPIPKVTTKTQVPATNRHTNPPSTRVSLPTDTAEHAPN